MASSTTPDAGFMTPLFGGAAIALALIAVAATGLVQSRERVSRQVWEQAQDRYLADGAVAHAGWRLLRVQGAPTLSWLEQDVRGAIEIIAEPEGRKLSLSETAGPLGATQLAGLLGAEEARALAPRLAVLAGTDGDPPLRGQILAANATPAWRACGLSLVSAFSRQTGNALSAASTGVAGAPSPRAGEVWRIAVVRKGRVLADQLVRFTGRPDAPVAVVDRLDPARDGDPRGCAARIASNAGRGA